MIRRFFYVLYNLARFGKVVSSVIFRCPECQKTIRIRLTWDMIQGKVYVHEEKIQGEAEVADVSRETYPEKGGGKDGTD